MPSRRQFLSTTAAALVSGPTFALGGKDSKKKGWAGGDGRMHKKFGAHWYYNWTPNREAGNPEFVPMIKGSWNVNGGTFNKIKGYPGITHLLGYNEPERKDQANMPMEKALELWPQLVQLAEAKNLKLGSPAPSSDDGGMRYLDEFMKQAKRKKLRVDFVAVHWYRSRDPDAFEDFVKDLAKKYRLPIWITEFNGWSGPEDENYDFLKDALRFLERDRKVERYAYFEPGAGKPHSLLKPDGSLTRMGELYRDAGT
ncbi:glycosyl hydrolase [Haloferula helveola]|uniref:Glycosyl hydrolase n=1 Tax=Haloferula helveola TaxID=490095 RepID=A0ABM7RJR5_9BACT|nr:glycosyl hydrolase [Haloferula helveola]